MNGESKQAWRACEPDRGDWMMEASERAGYHILWIDT